MMSSNKDAEILMIFAGAGGADSHDWARMLLRMYQRWAERSGLSSQIIDQIEGEGAGLKSVSIRISGAGVTERLELEEGVHRLVRISPFDDKARRHTTFALVELAGDGSGAFLWNRQVRSYILHPYRLVKDLRVGWESNEPEAILDGDWPEIGD